VTISPYLAIATPPVAVIPVLIGPLQVLIAILPRAIASSESGISIAVSR